MADKDCRHQDSVSRVRWCVRKDPKFPCAQETEDIRCPKRNYGKKIPPEFQCPMRTVVPRLPLPAFLGFARQNRRKSVKRGKAVKAENAGLGAGSREAATRPAFPLAERPVRDTRPNSTARPRLASCNSWYFKVFASCWRHSGPFAAQSVWRGETRTPDPQIRSLLVAKTSFSNQQDAITQIVTPRRWVYSNRGGFAA
jgi:hypothetical protein